MLHTGVDLIEIERVRLAVARYGERFLARVYTPSERAICGTRTESLAVRFAAKEAVAKALGTGIWRAGVIWTDIEVDRIESGAPLVRLHGGAQQRAAAMDISAWSISLSHNRTQAIAFVVTLAAAHNAIAE